MRVRLPALVILAFCVLTTSNANSEDRTKPGAFKMLSPVFQKNKELPARYTCDGTNVNPPMRIENVPSGTRSLALIFDDLDAPRGSYVHWIVWNIPPTTREIKENSVPEGAIQGMTDFKKRKYGGPCPPTRAHRYVFKMYALDTSLNLEPHAAKGELERAMAGHIIAEAHAMTTYRRKK